MKVVELFNFSVKVNTTFSNVNSLALCTFTLLCDCYLYLVPKHFLMKIPQRGSTGYAFLYMGR